MANQAKFYRVGYYTTRNTGKLTVELIHARNLSEARELAQMNGAIYIQFAHTFEYTDL